MIERIFILISITLIFTSCSLITPTDTGRANMIALNSISKEELTCKKRIYGNIVVNYPLIPEDLDTYRIAIMDKGRRDYLAGIRWAGFLPGIIQSAFTQSLNDAGNAFTDDHIVSGMQLLTEVRQFEIIYDTHGLPSMAVIEMRFQWSRSDSLGIKKQFVLSQSVNIKANNVPAIIDAFREGFSRLQSDLIAKLAGCIS